MPILPYKRDFAVTYAHTWAPHRNPTFTDYDKMGGDCTNFASQVLLAGGDAMQYGQLGWYYSGINNHSTSWTGVEFLYLFLVHNTRQGPFATPVPLTQAQPGDIIQLSFDGLHFVHSPVVVSIDSGILLAAHSDDADNRALDSYPYRNTRVLHILGTRT